MSRWIQVDDEVLGAIKAKAEPFADSPNDVLRKMLGLGQAETRPSCAPMPSVTAPAGGGFRGDRAQVGALLAMEEYEVPLLRALAAAGGAAPRFEIVEAVESMLEDKLTDLDRELLPSGGDVRWRNRLGFARLRAVERGHIRSDSRRGIWELSDAGFSELRRLEAEENCHSEEAVK